MALEICYEYISLTLETLQADKHFLDNIEFNGKAASSILGKADPSSRVWGSLSVSTNATPKQNLW